MAVETLRRQQAMELVQALPDVNLGKAILLLESLQAPIPATSPAPVPEREEADLLRIVQRRLPAADQNRLDELRASLEAGSLDDDRYAELLGFVERVEQEDAQRAEALIRLANLRQASLEELMRQLQIGRDAG